MDPVTLALLAAALGPALVTVLTKLTEAGIVEPSLETLLEWLNARTQGRHDQAEEKEKLKAILTKTLEPIAAQPDRYARWFKTFGLLHTNAGLLARTTAVAVEMMADHAELIPPELLRDLKLDEAERPMLASWLFALRKELLNVKGYGDGIRYANELDRAGLLREQLALARRAIELDEAFAADRRLTTDEAQALRDYVALAREQLHHMPLPLARRSGPEARADTELAEVFVPLNLRDPQAEGETRARQMREMQARARRAEQPEIEDTEYGKPISLGELFARHPRFLLKGPPGSGKTTLLRRAALAFIEGTAQADLNWNGGALLPVFLRLRNFGVFLAENRAHFTSPTPGALTAFMERHFREEHRLALSARFFDERLAEGQCLILLDGLDEVTVNRAEVAQCVAAFTRHFAGKGNRFGLASRPRGFESVEEFLRPAQLSVAEVDPLRAEGIRQLVGNLLRTLEADPVKRARDSDDLPQRIFDSRDLTLIAGTPLFCTALTLVYKYHGARLPQRRVEVYQEIVDLLLGFWKAQESDLARAHELAQEDGTGAAFLDTSAAVKAKKNRLAHLALWMQTERLTDAPADRARAVLAEYLRAQERKDEATAERWAENFLNNSHERSGVWVEVEAGTYAFTHQGFREYLAATALKNKREQDFVQAVLMHVADDWWEQVIFLAGAHPELSDATRSYLIEATLTAARAAPDSKTAHAHVLLAGQCAVDMGGYLPGPERQLVEQELYAAMTQPTRAPQQRLDAGLTLDALGWTPPDLYDFVRVDSPLPRSGKGAGGEGFFIAKYPVINLQYQRFLESDDYRDPTLWHALIAFDSSGRLEDLGNRPWEWFHSADLYDHKPGYWDDARLGATHRLLPVVGVTWYEAAAYCAWLTRYPPEGFALPPGWVFRLPTENEWLTAAGGVWKDKNIENKTPRYPWQKTPEPVTEKEIVKYANTSSSNLNGASPVGMYPAGVTPLGLMDIGGNVWEWQANLFDKGEVYRAVRGGSWNYNDVSARAAARNRYRPNLDWYNYGGFRVVAAPG